MQPEKTAAWQRQIDKLPSGNRAFVGRGELLGELDLWYADKRNRFLQIVADGGAGKTALVHCWLTKKLYSLKQQPRLAVHSFYGQAKSGRTSVDECLTALYQGVCEANSPPPASSDKLIEGICKACAEGPTLIVLDGFETQQDKNGLVEVGYLLMVELFLRLEQFASCKILVTSRKEIVKSGLPSAYLNSKKQVPGLERDDLFELFRVQFPETDVGRLWGKIAQCFPDRTQALVAVLALNALVEAGSVADLGEVVPSRTDIEAPTEGDVPSAIRQLVERSYRKQPEAEQFILRLIAIADEEVNPVLGADVAGRIGKIWSQEAFDKLASNRLVINRETGLDMHPRVRECLASLARGIDCEDFKSISIALANHAEAQAAGQEDRREALWAMHRAIVYRLRAGDLITALVENYFGFFSGEPNPERPAHPIEWRSIRKDLAYALENETLDELVRALSEVREDVPGLREALAELKRRQLYVKRSTGQIREADELGMTLANAEAERSVSTDGAMTAQVVLTKLIRGQVDNPPDDVRGAAYWSNLALKRAAAGFPEIRALVYQGAYLHRLNRYSEADAAFQRATELQQQLHAKNPKEPSCLFGLNAFLFLWFLIDNGELNRADHVVAQADTLLNRMSTATPSDADKSKQWRLMLTVPEAWLRQEQALSFAKDGQLAEAKTFLRRSESLLAALGAEDQRDRWSIPYDMRSVYVRTELRSRMINMDIVSAIAELEHRSMMYEVSEAKLFAADCQGDLLRFYASAHLFPENHWKRPRPSVVMKAADRLAQLADRYPFVHHGWYMAAPLQHIRRTHAQ